jgi:hypothetical protein
VPDPPKQEIAKPGDKALPPPVQKTVGSTGGEVTSNDGSGVEVPEGAVPGDVDISVAPAPDAPPPPAAVAEAVVGTPYVLGPSGLQFAKPVTIVLAFDPSKLPAGKSASDILVFTAPDGTSNYEPLKTKVRDASHVEAETTHFSIFVPTVPPEEYDAGLPPDSTPDAAPSCTPVLCGAYGPGACGPLDDKCGGTLSCPPCPTATPDAGTGGSDASTGGSDASTGGSDAGSGAVDASVTPDAGTGGGDGGTCMALTCFNYGGCGVFNNGCGGTIECKNNCDPDGGAGSTDGSAPMVDAGPMPDGGCTGPTSCAELGFKCGVFNFCGTDIDCSMYCGDGGSGGGTSDAGTMTDAGCSGPMSCAEIGYKCGVFEFCGSTLDCSAYCVDGGGTGGGGGTSDGGTTTDAGCTGPTTCAEIGYKCGVFDFCGVPLDCSAYCVDGGTSGGDGGGSSPDGGACVLKSCADYPGLCGFAPNGCGGEIYCDNNGDPNCLKQ